MNSIKSLETPQTARAGFPLPTEGLDGQALEIRGLVTAAIRQFRN